MGRQAGGGAKFIDGCELSEMRRSIKISHRIFELHASSGVLIKQQLIFHGQEDVAYIIAHNPVLSRCVHHGSLTVLTVNMDTVFVAIVAATTFALTVQHSLLKTVEAQIVPTSCCIVDGYSPLIKK